jgi:hypothetical protein
MEDIQKKYDELTAKLNDSIKKSVEETGEAMKISLREELLKSGVSKEDVDGLIEKNKTSFEEMLKNVNKRIDTIEIDAQKGNGGGDLKSHLQIK